MQLRYRHRIALLVALAAFGLVAATAVTLVLGRRSERQLVGIETQYVPLLELDYELSTKFAQITKALEDAAAAAEESRLADADRSVAELARRLDASADTIARNGGDARALAAELMAYYRVARGVSAALLHGASASELVGRIEQMRRDKLQFEADLDRATKPDRSRLASAFASARGAQRQALVGYVIVAVAVLALMGIASWRITWRMNRSLQSVSDGVERLARGDFAHEIVVASEDEIGDLAREANRTAVRLREYRDELESRNAELARTSNYKSEFLATMSHELRTPLNSIMILSKMLSENHGKTLSAKEIEYATLINRSGDELLGLINEVLDLAKIEAGKQTIECAWIPVHDITEYVRRMFAPMAAQKSLAFELDIAADLPERIRTDRTRLNQIIKNLVSNALKFTQRGAVRVRVYRPAPTAFPAIADPFAIAVVDTGIGIAADKLAQIFEAFTQADRGTSRKFGGTGLGLTIARRHAELLGGALDVESTVTSGSTFTVTLPSGGPGGTLDASEPPAVALPATPVPGLTIDPVLEGKAVLIVDDDMRNVYSLSSSLRDHKLEVSTAADGPEALDVLARDTRVDVILMDVMMPGMDGYETIRRIRAQERFRTTPIIALSARGGEDERARCLESGATDYLAKPIDVRALLVALRATLTTEKPADPVV